MIKKLRIKFVIINMSIVTVLLAMVLSLTYCLTRTRLETQSVRMMQRIAAAPFRESAGLQTGEDLRLPYFAVRLSPEGERLAAGGGYYDLTNAEIEALIGTVRDADQRMGVIPEYKLRYCRVDAPHSQYLVFADISSEIQTLRSLLQICLAIGLLGFLGFLGASAALSYWAVGPVDQAFRQQRQFVADASHELKTPLTVIRTNAQMLETYPENREIREKSLGNILTMSDQMKNLVEQLLTLAREDQPGQREKPRKLDLSHLTEQAALPFEPVFFEQGMTLETEISPGITVRGDPDQLRQVVEILLDNAAKYASPGAKTWLRLRPQGKHRCLLTVANQGEPIPRDRLDRFFERFATGDPSRNRRGSFGLGLAIARGIAENHHARLWAESREGINSFFLELARE